MVFYKCPHCGNIIAHIEDSGVRVVCCGEEMKPLVPNTTDAAGEKHVPVIRQEGNLVTVTKAARTGKRIKTVSVYEGEKGINLLRRDSS